MTMLNSCVRNRTRFNFYIESGCGLACFLFVWLLGLFGIALLSLSQLFELLGYLSSSPRCVPTLPQARGIFLPLFGIYLLSYSHHVSEYSFL